MKLLFLKIIFFLVLSFGALMSLKAQEVPDTANFQTISYEQTKKVFKINDSTLTIEGEYTYTIRDTRSGFRVSTDYQCVFDKILDNSFHGIKSYTVQYKHDRGGDYRHWVIYFEAGVKPAVLKYLRELP